MLRRVHIARLAFQHSPETEQRLLSYQQGNGNILNQNVDSENSGLSANTPKNISKHVQKIQNRTRQKMAFLNDLAKSDSDDADERNTILSTFFTEHEDFLNTYFQSELKQEFTPEFAQAATLDHLRQKFDKELNEISTKSLDSFGPKYNFYVSDAAFTRRFVRESLNLGPDEHITDTMLDDFRENNYVPNAFISGATIHFNMDHPDFNLEKKLIELRASRPNITEEQALEIVERNRERAVVHEITHFCLDREDRAGTSVADALKEQFKQALRVKKLEESPEWRALQDAVNAAFEGKFENKPDAEYLHEAIAISMAGQRKPYEKGDPRREVMTALKNLRDATKGNARIRGIMDKFDIDLTHQLKGDGKHEGSYDFARRKMDVATDDRTKNLVFKEAYEEHEKKHTADPGRGALDDAELKRKMQEEAEAEEKKEKDKILPEKVLENIAKVKEQVRYINDNKDGIIASFPKEAQESEGVALQQMMLRFNSDLDELSAVENAVKTLDKWEKGGVSRESKNAFATRWNFSHKGLYDDTTNASSVTELDKKNRPDRDELVKGLNGEVLAYFKPIEAVASGFKRVSEDEIDAISKKDRMLQYHDTTMFGWMKKHLWSSETSNIAWLSVFDMIKVYNIYKDAIMDRYHSKQKVRTYDAAKKWNVWGPLQPDLDKQARSANEEEVHSFKEFLEKEGFTYDQLFTEPGNVLERNKSNINRAKAVMEYAAAHAWLYHIDKHNGHDVYGIDYIGIFGERTFEELVEQNNAQQDKEKSNGRSKVDNYPDIPLLIEDIEHELKKKNLWMVFGIVERLQEKAKYAESNTWALVTILRMIREDKGIRDVMDKGLLDQLGGIGISQSAWSLTSFKIQRTDLMSWIKKGATEDAMKGLDNGDAFIGKVFHEIEHLLSDHPEHEQRSGRYAFDHKVAQVFAGQTVIGKDGKPVSIFDKNPVFDKYREFWKKNPTSTEPGKTDDDFFNPANKGSDLLLLPKTSIAAILVRTSQGQWTHSTKAPNFMAQVFMRDIELGNKKPETQAVFRREMKEKFAYFLREAITQTATREKFGTDTTPTGDNPEIADKNILWEMWHRDMISIDQYKALVLGINKDSTSSIVPIMNDIRAEKAKQDKLKEKIKELKERIPKDAAEKTSIDQDISRAESDSRAAEAKMNSLIHLSKIQTESNA